MAGGRGPERRRKGLRPVWESERVIGPVRPGNAGGGKGPYFWCACEGGKEEGQWRLHRVGLNASIDQNHVAVVIGTEQP